MRKVPTELDRALAREEERRKAYEAGRKQRDQAALDEILGGGGRGGGGGGGGGRGAAGGWEDLLLNDVLAQHGISAPARQHPPRAQPTAIPERHARGGSNGRGRRQQAEAFSAGDGAEAGDDSDDESGSFMRALREEEAASDKIAFLSSKLARLEEESRTVREELVSCTAETVRVRRENSVLQATLDGNAQRRGEHEPIGPSVSEDDLDLDAVGRLLDEPTQASADEDGLQPEFHALCQEQEQLMVNIKSVEDVLSEYGLTWVGTDGKEREKATKTKSPLSASSGVDHRAQLSSTELLRRLPKTVIRSGRVIHIRQEMETRLGKTPASTKPTTKQPTKPAHAADSRPSASLAPVTAAAPEGQAREVPSASTTQASGSSRAERRAAAAAAAEARIRKQQQQQT